MLTKTDKHAKKAKKDTKDNKATKDTKAEAIAKRISDLQDQLQKLARQVGDKKKRKR